MLWQFRDCIDKQNGFEYMWGTPAVNEDSMQEFNQSALEDIFDMDEYCGGGLNSAEQDEIVRNFSRMCVSDRGVESEHLKSLDTPLDPSIWSYILLLSSKIDEECILDLFSERTNAPTVNTLARMLQHSKLHTPIDFEIALNRKFGLLDYLGSRNRRAETGFKWRCTVLDKIGGRGTSSDTIFELKRMGVYHGVKRRKKFSNQ